MLHKEDLDECGLTMSNVGWVWIHMKVLKGVSVNTTSAPSATCLCRLPQPPARNRRSRYSFFAQKWYGLLSFWALSSLRQNNNKTQQHHFWNFILMTQCKLCTRAAAPAAVVAVRGRRWADVVFTDTGVKSTAQDRRLWRTCVHTACQPSSSEDDSWWWYRDLHDTGIVA